MTVVDITELKTESLREMGEWLDQYMPNPPLPEQQRWTLGYYNGITFFNEPDATHFSLRWL